MSQRGEQRRREIRTLTERFTRLPLTRKLTRSIAIAMTPPSASSAPTSMTLAVRGKDADGSCPSRKGSSVTGGPSAAATVLCPPYVRVARRIEHTPLARDGLVQLPIRADADHDCRPEAQPTPGSPGIAIATASSSKRRAMCLASDGNALSMSVVSRMSRLRSKSRLTS